LTRRGSGPKPSRLVDTLSVTYDASHWRLLKSLREKTISIFGALATWGNSALVHGSIARGDVDEKSDIDILIPTSVSTQLVEAQLASSGISPYSREITQATPQHSPKAHIYLDPERSASITIPLSEFRRLEFEFYKFGGTASFEDLMRGARRLGCTKRLSLIQPTDDGHMESPIIGRESEVARLLGVSSDIVRERIRVLTRRDAIGRTGVFLRLVVPEGASFEEVVKTEAESNPALRRTLRERQR
jgi:predicted nucleotidyltransferase